MPAGLATIKAAELPTDVSLVSDDICKRALLCSESGRPYRILASELAFYRRHGISLPRLHPDLRHWKRMALRGERELYVRTCDKTAEAMVSVYPQGVDFLVYSQQAYEQAIYG